MTRILVEPVEHIRQGKAQVFLRPEANALLRAAIAVYGRPIFPTGSGSAGRTYAQQDFFWQRFRRNGSPVASRPDRGPRPHMRFGAIDISDYRARKAMLRAGWVATTPSEWWHFEHPACRTWPVATETYTTPEPERLEDDMRLVQRTGSATAEWSLFHPSLAGPSPLQRGYYVITDPAEATDWARLLYRGGGTEQSEPRAVYVRLQESARTAHANYLRGLPQTLAPSGGAVGATAEQIAAEVIRQQKLPGN